MTGKRTYETLPLIIDGQTLEEAKGVLLKGLQRRVHIGPVWLDKLIQDQVWEKADPSPEHTVDPEKIVWHRYRHGGVTHLQAFYSWEDES